MDEIDIAGAVLVGVPLLLFFLTIWWIWGEEKRRDRRAEERMEEWRREIARFHESVKKMNRDE